MSVLCIEVDPSGALRVPQDGTCEYMAVTPSALYSVEVFDLPAFSYGVLGVLVMFGTGAAVGLVLNVLRKARI